MTEYVFATSEDGPFNYDSVDEAVQSSLNWIELGLGEICTVYRGVKDDRLGSSYVDMGVIEDLLYTIEERATDVVGDCADGFTVCNSPARQELLSLVQDWVDRSLTCTFYPVEKVEPVHVEVTEAHLE